MCVRQRERGVCVGGPGWCKCERVKIPHELPQTFVILPCAKTHNVLDPEQLSDLQVL